MSDSDREAIELKERIAEAESHAAMLQDDRDRFEEWCWQAAEVITPGARDGFNSRQFKSVKMFVERIGLGNTREAAHIAVDRFPEGQRRFKYFCGACWKMAKEGEVQA